MVRSFCLGVVCATLVLVYLGRGVTTAAPRPAGDPPASAADARGLEQGLPSLPFLSHARTRSVCAENPTGGKGQGGRAVPNRAEVDPPASGRAADELGQGWKVRPFLRVNKGQAATLMDVDGPGMIQHIWMAGPMKWSRAHVLRFYWDGEETPSIEVPAADFFAVGHGKFAPVNSLAVVTNPQDALNCYWPMPFRRHAKVTFTNDSPTDDVTLLAYQITYAETPIDAAAGYLHAQFRRARTDRDNPYVILDGVRGQGRYVGTFLAWVQREKGWFGEGEIKFFMDGDRDFPTICGTGTEDYFCGSYGFSRPYTGPYTGTTLPASESAEPPSFWSLYRWHIMDPINFEQDLRVTIQALGWKQGQPLYKKLSDDVASVAFWYQAEPHAPFPKLPPLADRTATVLPAPAE
ncbi:hypothetical protein OJF2_45230 [Aquisphaera giovannonii]|uniref:DUF2961 domain-containing protein n=1 Tax=Aquisphaera giovannonii TaxID=406548 RepID=A0A5B9W5L6_9BACT|nr:glycoside hydrolase family 172 protein [Aquisphaera giovannonii]QEH35966.1 hypothetical protein OJF2_45230 [Aquisphaera giovannonii]